jgi:ferredoxin
MRRKIIRIDEGKCTGCGDCIPNCPEGALQVIDGNARLVSDLFCDGLGACVGHCPEGAITIEEREAEPYDERRVMETIVRQGPNVIRAHLAHLKKHGAHEYYRTAVGYLEERKIAVPEGADATAAVDTGCPHCAGSAPVDLRAEGGRPSEREAGPRRPSRLGQWPVQIHLVPVTAPYFRGADLLLAADCVPFAFPEFHEELLRGRVLLVGCPKLDDAQFYVEKITQILRQNDVRSVTVAHMEVPCCTGLVKIAEAAIAGSGKRLPLRRIEIGIRGEVNTSSDPVVRQGQV